MIIYDKTITIINKLRAQDSLTKLDVYYKTVLTNCAWYEEAVTGVQGTTVSLSYIIKVLIPFDTDSTYVPYNEWKLDGKQSSGYTMSQNDVIILGEVSDDIITSQVLTKLKREYTPNVCEVRHCRVVDRRNDFVTIQLLIEGV